MSETVEPTQDTTDEQSTQDAPQDSAQANEAPQDGEKTFPESHVKELRTENAARRKENTDLRAELDALKAGLGKVLGFGDDTSERDIEKTVAEITTERDNLATEAARAKQELVALRAAAKVGANADRLLDSRRFIDKLADLDSTASDYATQVESLIQDSVKADPSLSLTPPSSSSGTHEHQGGSSSDENDPDWFRRKFYLK